MLKNYFCTYLHQVENVWIFKINKNILPFITLPPHSTFQAFRRACRAFKRKMTSLGTDKFHLKPTRVRKVFKKLSAINYMKDLLVFVPVWHKATQSACEIPLKA